jgi:hypothetical protein
MMIQKIISNQLFNSLRTVQYELWMPSLTYLHHHLPALGLFTTPHGGNGKINNNNNNHSFLLPSWYSSSTTQKPALPLYSLPYALLYLFIFLTLFIMMPLSWLPPPSLPLQIDQIPDSWFDSQVQVQGIVVRVGDADGFRLRPYRVLTPLDGRMRFKSSRAYGNGLLGLFSVWGLVNWVWGLVWWWVGGFARNWMKVVTFGIWCLLGFGMGGKVWEVLYGRPSKRKIRRGALQRGSQTRGNGVWGWVVWMLSCGLRGRTPREGGNSSGPLEKTGSKSRSISVGRPSSFSSINGGYGWSIRLAGVDAPEVNFGVHSYPKSFL